MPAPFVPQAPGQRFAPLAIEWNAARAAGQEWLGRGGQVTAQTVAPGGRPYLTAPVKNDTGADRKRFDVMGINGLVFSPEDNEAEYADNFALKCGVPDEDVHPGKFVVLSQSIPAGKIGRGYIAGIFPCLVDIQNPTDQYAEMFDADTAALRSGDTGSVRLVYVEDTAPGPPTRCLVRVDGTGGMMAPAGGVGLFGQVVETFPSIPGFVGVQPLRYTDPSWIGYSGPPYNSGNVQCWYQADDDLGVNDYVFAMQIYGGTWVVCGRVYVCP